MLEIPINPDWHKQRDKHGEADASPCVVCGRAVPSAGAKAIRVWSGVYAVTDAEMAQLAQDEPGGDTGYLPIGANCLRKHPELRPYAQ